MKSLKKFCILSIIFIMLTMFILPVMASPVIEPNEKGSITIHKYAIDESMNLNLNANGTMLPPTTVITNDGIKLEELYPLANVEFTIVRVRDNDTDPKTAEVLTGANQYSKTLSTDANGIIGFTNLDIGTYMISEVSNQAISEPVESFLVSIPMTNPTGTGWIYDVHVYPKNKLAGAPEIDKFVTNIGNKYSGADLNSEITWHITTEMPSTGISNAIKYQIHDDLHQYLKYVNGSIEVYLKDDTSEIPLTFNNHYIFTLDGTGFNVTLTTDGFAFIDYIIDTNSAIDGFLYVKYKTTLEIPEDELEGNLGKPISGNAYDSYINATGVPYSDSVDVRPAVHVGGINILKVDGNNNNVLLSGAKFKIYRSESDAKNGINAIKTPGGSEDWEVVTSTNGLASFYGLAYGDMGITASNGIRDYWIVETQAPSHENGYYNLLRNPVKVTVSANSHIQTNNVIVENNKGFLLPITGGIGTIIFTVLGLIFISVAILIFFLSKRKNDKEIKTGN